MSANTELARFDTRPRRAAQNDENSEQTDFRAVGAREHGQLALDEINAAGRDGHNRFNIQATAEEPDRADLEAALECARATIDGLRGEVAELEAEHDRLREEMEADR